MIDISAATVRPAGNTRLDHVDLHVEPGELYCLAGPPQSGKSLLCDVMLGRHPLTSGRVTIDGIDISQDAVRSRTRVTAVASTGALLPEMSIRRNVAWLLQLVDIRPSRSEIDDALRESEIPDRHFPMAARDVPRSEWLNVWLAVKALRRTPVLLLDDPARDLGVIAAERLADLLDRHRRQGTTVFVTCRDERFLQSIPHRQGLLDDGVLTT